MKKKIKIGLALGAGGARGLTHIGVLKVLHKHNIYPNYIAGTSMGAVIGASYAAGHSPEDIEDIAKTTDWKHVVDFTIPKAGLVQGKFAEKKIRGIVRNKKFGQLKVPLKVIAYNFSKNEKVIFSRGSVAEAVRASISIPGIFAPPKIHGDHYIDGAVVDPIPFDIVKEMGADIVIAVDLFSSLKTVQGPIVKEEADLLSELKKELVIAELANIENWIFPKRWPRLIRKILRWSFEKILYPAKVLKIIAGREPPMITKVLYGTINILTNNLAKEKIKNAKIDIIVTPIFDHLSWADFDKVDTLVKLGEEAMEKEIGKLKKIMQA